LTVGWRDEPTVAGYLNGLDLGIQHRFSNGTTVWVVGVAGNLTAVLTTGPKGGSKALEPQADRDGWYTFDVIPARVGTYTVRLQGTLRTTPVDAMVPLDDVSPASDFAFPVADQPASDLQSRLDAANAAIAGLQWQLGVAVALAVLGILMAAAGVMMGRRMSKVHGRSHETPRTAIRTLRDLRRSDARERARLGPRPVCQFHTFADCAE